MEAHYFAHYFCSGDQPADNCVGEAALSLLAGNAIGSEQRPNGFIPIERSQRCYKCLVILSENLHWCHICNVSMCGSRECSSTIPITEGGLQLKRCLPCCNALRAQLTHCESTDFVDGCPYFTKQAAQQAATQKALVQELWGQLHSKDAELQLAAQQAVSQETLVQDMREHLQGKDVELRQAEQQAAQQAATLEALVQELRRQLHSKDAELQQATQQAATQQALVQELQGQLQGKNAELQQAVQQAAQQAATQRALVQDLRAQLQGKDTDLQLAVQAAARQATYVETEIVGPLRERVQILESSLIAKEADLKTTDEVGASAPEFRSSLLERENVLLHAVLQSKREALQKSEAELAAVRAELATLKAERSTLKGAAPVPVPV